MTDFSGKAHFFKSFVDKIIEQNFVDPSQIDKTIKSLIMNIEKSVKEAVHRAARPEVNLKVRRLAHFNGELPKYETSGASGFDVQAQLSEKITLAPGERHLVPTGLSFEIPEGFEIQVRPRSGLAIKKGLSMVNTPGTIDADYRGEVKVIIINHGSESVEIHPLDRIAQFVVCPVIQASLIEAEELTSTERGSGGFGSTGVSTEAITPS